MAATACILGCSGPALLDAERRFFSRVRPWGFILFARNVEEPAQLRRLTAALRDAAGHDAPVFIDQEGGRVARLGPPHWRSWPAPLDEATRPDARAAEVFDLRYRLIAAELREVGIDGNCAPLGDIAGPRTHPVLRNRCYGGEAGTVARIGRAVAGALLAGGVLPVLKHIPGHGRATVDSHLDLPRVGAPLAVLRATDFAPFRALADLPLGMTAHIVYDALDPDRPATQSGTVIGVIRDEIGFDGVLMTDDISMSALSGAPGDRAAAARAAGCDMVLHCNGDLAEMAEIAAASGPLDGAAADRAARALAARRAPGRADSSALAAAYARLAGGADGG